MTNRPTAAVLPHLYRSLARDSRGQSDAQLLQSFLARRDEAAFAALVRRHGPMVFAVCRRVLGDRHAAEDACQAAFLVLARKAASLGRPELLANWLYGVAYRTALSARADERRRHAREAEAGRPLAVEPPDEALRAEVRAMLDEEVHRLPAKYRAAVVLCYLQGYTHAEAASALGCPRGTVATRLARACQRLRRRLDRRGLAPAAGLA